MTTATPRCRSERLDHRTWVLYRGHGYRCLPRLVGLYTFIGAVSTPRRTIRGLRGEQVHTRLFLHTPHTYIRWLCRSGTGLPWFLPCWIRQRYICYRDVRCWPAGRLPFPAIRYSVCRTLCDATFVTRTDIPGTLRDYTTHTFPHTYLPHTTTSRLQALPPSIPHLPDSPHTHPHPPLPAHTPYLYPPTTRCVTRAPPCYPTLPLHTHLPST